MNSYSAFGKSRRVLYSSASIMVVLLTGLIVTNVPLTPLVVVAAALASLGSVAVAEAVRKATPPQPWENADEVAARSARLHPPTVHIDAVLDASFPASDAPSWTTVGSRDSYAAKSAGVVYGNNRMIAWQSSL